MQYVYYPYPPMPGLPGLPPMPPTSLNPAASIPNPPVTEEQFKKQQAQIDALEKSLKDLQSYTNSLEEKLKRSEREIQKLRKEFTKSVENHVCLKSRNDPVSVPRKTYAQELTMQEPVSSNDDVAAQVQRMLAYLVRPTIVSQLMKHVIINNMKDEPVGYNEVQELYDKIGGGTLQHTWLHTQYPLIFRSVQTKSGNVIRIYPRALEMIREKVGPGDLVIEPVA